jgi:bacterioferritin-associated ferredoxin
MYVCHCRVVSDRSVRAAISQGAGDVDAVMDVCGLGDGCGGCLPAVEELLAEAAMAVHEPQRLMERQRTRRGARRVALAQPA